jgi:hypothetical protein
MIVQPRSSLAADAGLLDGLATHRGCVRGALFGTQVAEVAVACMAAPVSPFLGGLSGVDVE